jgi:GNAT superfamily N-acetyltransferase
MSSSAPIEMSTGSFFKPLDAEFDDSAGALLDGCPELLAGLTGRDRISAARLDPDTDLYGVVMDGQLAAIFALRRAHLMNELELLVVAEEKRGQGLGKAALSDAVRRSGRRPLALECSESLRPYFLKNGYKMVGKRKGPNGEPRYRLGAHAPRPKNPHPQTPSPNAGERGL